MEIIISVVLGGWLVLAGVVCFLSYQKDVKDLINNDDGQERSDNK